MLLAMLGFLALVVYLVFRFAGCFGFECRCWLLLCCYFVVVCLDCFDG